MTCVDPLDPVHCARQDRRDRQLQRRGRSRARSARQDRPSGEPPSRMRAGPTPSAPPGLSRHQRRSFQLSASPRAGPRSTPTSRRSRSDSGSWRHATPACAAGAGARRRIGDCADPVHREDPARQARSPQRTSAVRAARTDRAGDGPARRRQPRRSAAGPRGQRSSALRSSVLSAGGRPPARPRCWARMNARGSRLGHPRAAPSRSELDIRADLQRRRSPRSRPGFTTTAPATRPPHRRRRPAAASAGAHLAHQRRLRLPTTASTDPAASSPSRASGLPRSTPGAWSRPTPRAQQSSRNALAPAASRRERGQRR